MFIAGWGTFLLLRTLKVGRFGSLVAAVTFMFGGSMTVWQNYVIGNAYAWMPVLFFLGERLLVSRRLLCVPLTGFVIAVQILGGHYQTSFIMLVAWSLFCVYRAVDSFRRNGNGGRLANTLFLLLGAAALGFMLVAVQLLPFWDWLQQTSEVRIRLQERSSSWIDAIFWKGTVVTLVTLVLPNLNGNPTWGSPIGFFYSNYIEQMVYMGVVPLVLAILAIAGTRSKAGSAPGQHVECSGSSWPNKGLIVFLACMGAFFLGMALRLPPFDLVNHLPVFSVVSPSRWRLVFTFCVSVLAGIGAERVLSMSVGAPALRYLPWGLLAFALLGTALLIVVRWMLVSFKDALVTYNRIRTNYPIMVQAFSLSNVTMYFSILVGLAFAGVIALYRKGLLGRPLLVVLLLVLVLIDLFAFGRSFNPAIPQDHVFPRTESVQFLQERLTRQDLVRIVAMRDDLPPETGTPYGFSEISGADFPSQRYLELARAAGGRMIAHNRMYFSVVQPRLLSIMNVKYVITSAKPKGLPSEQFREVYCNSSVTIYENAACLPRAYTVHRVHLVEDDREMLRLLVSPDFDPARAILVEESPAFDLPENASPHDDVVHIERYSPEQVCIQVEMAENGFLFLSDAHYPGWQAFVDGEETKIYRANYAFRSVYLPKGKHLVQFTYTPVGFGLGLAVTVAGLVLALALAVISWRKGAEHD